MDDLAALVASTLITKGSEALVSGTTGAVRALAALVRKRFSSDVARGEVLRDAIAYPEDAARRVRLVDALADVMQRDPAFAQQLRSRWQSASVELAADHGAVVNQFTGQADKIVQARDIHGDLSL